MKFFLTSLLLIFSIHAFGQTTKNDSTSVLPPDYRTKILTASKDGGKLDFWTPIKGHEFDGEVIEKGETPDKNVIATKKEIAIMEWAFTLSKLGITNRADIVSLFEELKGRKVNSEDEYCIDYGIKKAKK